MPEDNGSNADQPEPIQIHFLQLAGEAQRLPDEVDVLYLSISSRIDFKSYSCLPFKSIAI